MSAVLDSSLMNQLHLALVRLVFASCVYICIIDVYDVYAHVQRFLSDSLLINNLHSYHLKHAINNLLELAT